MKIFPESGMEPKEYLEYLRDISKDLLSDLKYKQDFNYEKSNYLKYCLNDFTARIQKDESLNFFIVFQPHNYKDTVFEILEIHLQLPCIDDKEKRDFNNLLIYWIKLRVDEDRKLKPFDVKNEGCYFATMVYGSYEHPQVLELRKFRDKILNKTITGRLFINTYYFISPKLVVILKNKKIINKIIRKGLNQLIKILK